jgi:hypothetical protein
MPCAAPAARGAGKRDASSWNALRTAAELSRPSRTRFNSLLWDRSGPVPLRATGYPRRCASATASSSEATAWHSTIGTPASRRSWNRSVSARTPARRARSRSAVAAAVVGETGGGSLGASPARRVQWPIAASASRMPQRYGIRAAARIAPTSGFTPAPLVLFRKTTCGGVLQARSRQAPAISDAIPASAPPDAGESTAIMMVPTDASSRSAWTMWQNRFTS